MRRVMLFAALLCISVVFVHCSDNGPDGDGDIGSIGDLDSIAAYWFAALGDTIEEISERDPEELRNLDLSEIEAGFGSVLRRSSKHPLANLGTSLLEIIELSYNPDVWELIDDINMQGGNGSAAFSSSAVRRRPALLGRQFSMLVEVPFSMSVKRAMMFPPDVTIERIQQIIEDNVIPALDRSIRHLERVEENTDTRIEIENKYDDGLTETLIIDLGEIYFFNASVYALRAAFKQMVAYDLDFIGPDGTYSWIDYMLELGNKYSCAQVWLTSEGGDDYLNGTEFYYGGEQAETDSILARVLHYNLTGRSGFLSLRKGGDVLESAHADILGMVTKLELSVDFIRNVRENETEENIIKLTDLTDLDSDIPGYEPPNFAKEFDTIEDVLVWVKSFLSEEIIFTENLGPSKTPFTWRMNMSALWDGSISNWKPLLPRHKWMLPEGNWITRECDFYGCYANTQNPFTAYVYSDGMCQETEFWGIEYLCGYECQAYMSGEPFMLTKEDGETPLDQGEFPYFPSYTINGLFPDMTRDRWIELMQILD